MKRNGCAQQISVDGDIPNCSMKNCLHRRFTTKNGLNNIIIIIKKKKKRENCSEAVGSENSVYTCTTRVGVNAALYIKQTAIDKSDDTHVDFQLILKRNDVVVII